jgi:hypothetical protein
MSTKDQIKLALAVVSTVSAVMAVVYFSDKQMKQTTETLAKECDSGRVSSCFRLIGRGHR